MSVLTQNFDVLVIGSGPAGATAALLLARFGFSVAIVEKSVFPRRKVCGEYLSSTNLNLFRQLGIFEDFVQTAGPEISRVGLFSDSTILTANMPRSGKSQNYWGRALRREILDTLLLNRAVEAGAKLWQPYSAIDVARTNEGFLSRLVSKETNEDIEIKTRFVIAAHGSWEIGKLPTQPKRRSSNGKDLLGFKAHYKETNLPQDLMPMIVFPGGYGGMVSCDGGFVSLSCCIRRDMLQEIRHRSPYKKVGKVVEMHILESCKGVSDVLSNAKLNDEWLSAGPIRPGIRLKYDKGIFIVGNAAGESHPIIAEGISMAIQSAWLLCRKFANKKQSDLNKLELEKIANDYNRDWLRAFAPRIKAADAFAYLAMNNKSHKVLSQLLQRFPSLLTFGAKLSGKVMNVVV